MRSLSVLILALLGLVALSQSGAAADQIVDGVPLPSDANLAPTTAFETSLQRQWVGPWIGSWGETLKHLLLVESVAPNGIAQVVYAIGDNPALSIRRRWIRHNAVVSERSLTISDTGFSATYEARDGNRLLATFVRGPIRSRAMMARANLPTLTTPGAAIDWTIGETLFLHTDLVEDDHPIRLETVIFKPTGTGPFPLAVINHGSTGDGTNPALFRDTWFDIGLADFLNQHGWMAAFPQRRGRGKSDGLYDEGFSLDRAGGYTGDTDQSLAGAERALRDIEAAVGALRRLPDVASSRILIGGQSRGGVLSVAYSGKHPEEIAGVINYVGGWLGDHRATAKIINQTLFKQGARFARPTLWLYGRHDPFYTISHSQENFVAFQEAGGQGTFLDFDVPDGNGHRLIGYSQLWSGPVGDYLKLLAVPEK